jgi:hypothetical protein
MYKLYVCVQALGVFGLCQIYAFVEYVRSKLTKEQFNVLLRAVVLVAAVAFGLTFGIASLLGSILDLVSKRSVTKTHVNIIYDCKSLLSFRIS